MATRTLYLAIPVDGPGFRTTATIDVFDADDFSFIMRLWDPDLEGEKLVQDIAEDPAGNIYVHLRWNGSNIGDPLHVIKVFDNTGAFLYSVTIAPYGANYEFARNALFVTGVDEIYVLKQFDDGMGTANTTLCKFDHLGALLDSWVLNSTTFAGGHIAIVGDVCYYLLYRYNLIDPVAIKRWDLIDDLPLSDFFINTVYKGNSGNTDYGLGYFRPTNDGGWSVPQGETFIGWTAGNYIIYLDSFGNVINVTTLDTLPGHELYTSYLGNDLITKGFNFWANRVIISSQNVSISTDCSPSKILDTSTVDVFQVPFLVTGPDVEGVCPVTNLSVDCNTKNIIITGAHFPDIPGITLRFNGADVAFDIILVSPTQIIIHPAFFANGTWCAFVTFGE